MIIKKLKILKKFIGSLGAVVTSKYAPLNFSDFQNITQPAPIERINQIVDQDLNQTIESEVKSEAKSEAKSIDKVLNLKGGDQIPSKSNQQTTSSTCSHKSKVGAAAKAKGKLEAKNKAAQTAKSANQPIEGSIKSGIKSGFADAFPTPNPYRHRYGQSLAKKLGIQRSHDVFNPGDPKYHTGPSKITVMKEGREITSENQANTNQAKTNQAKTNQANTNQAKTNQANTNQPNATQVSTNQPNATQTTKLTPKLVSEQESEAFNPDGTYKDYINLSPKGKQFSQSARKRRSTPMFKLSVSSENEEHDFKPVVSEQQLGHSEHQKGIEEKFQLESNYSALPTNTSRKRVDLERIQALLAHPDTKIDTSTMAQGREPATIATNDGKTGYPYPQHMASFERRPEISELNPYITDYVMEDWQWDNYHNSNGTEIPYEDLYGNPQVNVGTYFGNTSKASNASQAAIASQAAANANASQAAANANASQAANN